ncbi:MAG: hypothetical protein MHM6MM_004149 [Cercozoa sp. M6MM]
MKKGEKCVLTCRADYAYGDRAQGKIPAGATLKFEVELLSWTSLKKVTSDGAVQREIEMEGSGYDTPELLDEVTLEVTQLTPQQGETQTLHLPLLDDAEHVIKGIREAVREMKQGETSRIVIKVPSQYTHETEGVVCEDTQEEAVQYRLTLKELVPAKKTWDMSHEEKLERVQNRKAAGNELLKAGNLGRALDKYVQAVEPFKYDADKVEDAEARLLLCQVYTNMAMAHYKRQEFKQARDSAVEALKSKDDHVKALLWKARALLAVKEYADAIDAARVAATHQDDPAHALAQKVLQTCEAAKAKYDQKEAARLRKIMRRARDEL